MNRNNVRPSAHLFKRYELTVLVPPEKWIGAQEGTIESGEDFCYTRSDPSATDDTYCLSFDHKSCRSSPRAGFEQSVCNRSFF